MRYGALVFLELHTILKRGTTMKYILFSEAKIGGVLRRPVLITGITEALSRNGKPFLKITMKDGAGEQTATMFDMTEEKLASNKGIIKYCIADADMNVTEFQGGKSFIVNNISVCRDPKVSMSDFVKSPPIDTEVMYNEICAILKGLSGDSSGYTPLSELALQIINDKKKQYITSSAAIAMHHNILGGLIYHSYRMTKAAEAMCGVYNILDRELMICGAVLHDIGKIWEYDTTEVGDSSFTADGVLFGHLFIGAELVQKYADKMNCSPEKVRLLKHMIVSHHGKQEWGAAVTPATPEAMALHLIDCLDARMYNYEDAYQQVQQGEISEKRPIGLDNRVYHADMSK